MPRVLMMSLLFVLLLVSAAASAREPSAAGSFDYYVLSLSWSPEFCASADARNAAGQCATDRRYGFVLHGLWPQYERGGYPATCNAPAPVPDGLVQRMLPIMPAAGLVRHAWTKHGTCTGLSPDGYFEAATRAYQSVRIPPPYQHPSDDLTVGVSGLKTALQSANPALQPQDMAVICKARYLLELRLCLTKDLQPRPCGPDIRDQCRGEDAILRRTR